jgi:lysophospholipase L1-like esterase
LPDTEAFVGKVDGGSVEKYSGTLTASNYYLLTNRIYRKNLPISVTLTTSGKVSLAFNSNSVETFNTAGTYERVYTPNVDVSRIGFYVHGLPTSVNIDLTVTDGFFSLVDNISNDLAEEFSTSSSYPVGYLVSYFKKLYMFVKTKATGAWNSSLCVPVKIIDLISKLKEDIIKPFFIEKNNVEKYSFTFSDGGYISAYSGNYVADANGHCTDYIRVSPGDRVYLAVSINNSSAKVACYDFWKNYLPSSSLITDGSYAGIFEVPSGVSYIRISSWGSSSYTAYNIPKYNLVPIQKNSDLNVLVFGDSITEDFFFTINSSGETTAVSPKATKHNWSYYSNLHLNFKELRNYAKSGASYKDYNFGTWDRMSIAEQVLVAINDKTNPQNVWSENNFEPDIIIFAAGTNDGVPNDTPESALAKIVYDEDGSVNTTATLAALNRSKFCEAVMWSMLKIRIEFPYALGMCLLPIQRCANDVPFGDVNSYLTTMARRYGFIPVDGISECGIIKDNNKKSAAGDTLSDGLHPNTDGAKMMARMMIQAIDRYFYPVFRD